MRNSPQTHNIKPLKNNRNTLRNNLTPAEATLWKAIKNSQLKGRKFRRQHSVGGFILDFYCVSEKLAIELDGAHHYTYDGALSDEERDEKLNQLGIRIIRFENKDVFDDIDYVLDEIVKLFID